MRLSLSGDLYMSTFRRGINTDDVLRLHIYHNRIIEQQKLLVGLTNEFGALSFLGVTQDGRTAILGNNGSREKPSKVLIAAKMDGKGKVISTQRLMETVVANGVSLPPYRKESALIYARGQPWSIYDRRNQRLLSIPGPYTITVWSEKRQAFYLLIKPEDTPIRLSLPTGGKTEITEAKIGYDIVDREFGTSIRRYANYLRKGGYEDEVFFTPNGKSIFIQGIIKTNGSPEESYSDPREVIFIPEGRAQISRIFSPNHPLPLVVAIGFTNDSRYLIGHLDMSYGLPFDKYLGDLFVVEPVRWKVQHIAPLPASYTPLQFFETSQ